MNISWYKYFNYGSIVFVAVLILLLLTKAVGVEFYKPFLYLSIFIFVLRIIVRMIFFYKKKSKE